MNIINYWHTYYSSLEGAMKLKLAPFCSSSNALSDGMILEFPVPVAKRFQQVVTCVC